MLSVCRHITGRSRWSLLAIMNKKTYIIRLCTWLCLLAVLLGLLSACEKQKENTSILTETTVIVTVDGKEAVRVPLSQPQTLTISQENGAVNVIEITSEGAVMRSSTCENQLCVHMGAVTVDNWETRVNGAFIICLPNRVSVELAVKE